MAADQAKWHWEEGLKYANELLKSLLIINGAAAIALLTFIGNTKVLNGQIVLGMVSFGLGVIAAVIAMLGAYLTQLSYGNAELDGLRQPSWRKATGFHYLTYGAVFLSLVLFATGIGLVGWGGFIISSLPSSFPVAPHMVST